MSTLIVSNPALISCNPAPARPVPARTRMMPEAPILPTLLRFSAPNVLNLLAIAGLIMFVGNNGRRRAGRLLAHEEAAKSAEALAQNIFSLRLAGTRHRVAQCEGPTPLGIRAILTHFQHDT